jgi:hypothetical protein
MRLHIKYSHKKLWYPAFLVRGLSIDEAIKQLSFNRLKGASIIKEVSPFSILFFLLLFIIFQKFKNI